MRRGIGWFEVLCVVGVCVTLGACNDQRPGDALGDAPNDVRTDATDDTGLGDSASDNLLDASGDDADEDCSTVCVDWAGPAPANATSAPWLDNAEERTCTGPGALDCPVGTECVERSLRFDAFREREAVCEVRDTVLQFDIGEPAGAVEVELLLSINGEPVAGPDDDSSRLHDDPYQVWVRPTGPGRDVLREFDPFSGVASLRLPPGEYVLHVDVAGCDRWRPFVHREARLQVFEAGQATLDIVAAPLLVTAEVDGVAVDWGVPASGGTVAYSTGGIALEGEAGASCTVRSRARSGNPVLVQLGEVSVSTSVDAEGVAGVLGPQPVTVARAGTSLMLTGSTAPMSSLFVPPEGWEVTGGTLTLQHPSGLSLSTQWLPERAVLVSLYETSGNVRIVGGGASGRESALWSWSAEASEFASEPPLVLHDVTVVLRPEGWSDGIRDVVVAEFGDTLSATLTRIYDSAEPERLLFRGLLPVGEARLSLVAEPRGELGSAGLDAPLALADSWNLQSDEREFDAVASSLAIRFPAVERGEVMALPGARGQNLPFTLRYESLSESQGAGRLGGRVVDSGTRIFESSRGMSLTLARGTWRVVAEVRGAAGTLQSTQVEVELPRDELSLELSAAEWPLVEFLDGGEVVWSGPWPFTFQGPGFIAWPTFVVEEFEEVSITYVAQHLVR